jgi:crotonobetainyl-CoA:carnitine CoA-transferase CaiB-like acyl-CoA transferase
MLLGDLGARVLKVEPLEGDWARQLEPRQGSHSAVFLALNRNKESLAVDYQTAAGREIMQRLARRADMVICEILPDQARALGLDYATLAAHNPQLIYGLLTPFGEHGPWANRIASELVVQAASGYPRYLGRYGDEPVRIGTDAASTVGGVFLLQGLLAALFYRLRHGVGQRVAVSQLGALYAVKTIQIAAQCDPDTWEGYHCWGPYNPPDTGWQTQDRPIVFSFGEFTGGGPGKQSQWPAFCHALGLDHLLQDQRFEPDGKNSTGLGADVAALRSLYEAAFRHYPAAELVALIRRLEGAAYPYHTYETLFADAQAHILQLLQRLPGPEGDLAAIKTPWNFSTLRPVVRCGPPTLGNATGTILEELGYETAQRQQLFAAGVVAGARGAARPPVPTPLAPSGAAPGRQPVCHTVEAPW